MLFPTEASVQPHSRVECLGLTFESDDARRIYFLGKLREKLADPEFRKIDGFPMGSDEDILALSDPPYYTACPNPFIEDFIQCHGKPYDPSVPYSREPFATDVSEGKNDPIYNAHSYHTKVPHKAIMRYILHYTQPGDVVFDGFCGTGMTGVAAQLCGDKVAVEDLGLHVQNNGCILDHRNNIFGLFGTRHAVMGDLSPFASFVASRYNDFIPQRYEHHSIKDIITDLKIKLGALYNTKDPENGANGKANFYVWSEVFSCPQCAFQTSLFEFAVDPSSYTLKNRFVCPSCHSELTKDDLERIWTNIQDTLSNRLIQQTKYILVEVAAQFGSYTKRFSPTQFDMNVLENIQPDLVSWVPTEEFPHGRQTRKVKTGSGISTITQMFTLRALTIVSLAWERACSTIDLSARYPAIFLISSVLTLLSRRERFRNGTGKGAQSGTLYVPSLQIEKNAFDVVERKRSSFATLDLHTSKQNGIVTCQNHGDLQNIPSNSIDYIFTDRPFGESLQYGELNFFHESWLRVHTRLEDDCVLNYVHNKDLVFYQHLMKDAFSEACRILKPGRWITVEFHNSQNSVWIAIQEALWQAGFTVADVRVLDKKQGTFNVVNRAGAVKQDLVISAYKPNSGLEERFKLEAGTEDGVWDFVRTHLKQLPVFVAKDGQAEIIAERQNLLALRPHGCLPRPAWLHRTAFGGRVLSGIGPALLRARGYVLLARTGSRIRQATHDRQRGPAALHLRHRRIVSYPMAQAAAH